MRISGGGAEEEEDYYVEFNVFPGKTNGISPE